MDMPQLPWILLVSSVAPAYDRPGLTLRQAALIAGFSYLLMSVSLAEFYIYPKLVIRGNIDHTAQNIAAHGTLFAVAILCRLGPLYPGGAR